MQFEKEDRGSSQENTTLGDTDPTDSQTVFASLMVNGSLLFLKSHNESWEKKTPHPSPFYQCS